MNTTILGGLFYNYNPAVKAQKYSAHVFLTTGDRAKGAKK